MSTGFLDVSSPLVQEPTSPSVLFFFFFEFCCILIQRPPYVGFRIPVSFSDVMVH